MLSKEEIEQHELNVYYDSVIDYDKIIAKGLESKTKHLAEALENKTQKEQKILIISVMAGLTGVQDSDIHKFIMDSFIKPPFYYLVKQGKLKRIPDWIELLENVGLAPFMMVVRDRYFNGDMEKLKKAMKDTEITT